MSKAEKHDCYRGYSTINPRNLSMQELERCLADPDVGHFFSPDQREEMKQLLAKQEAKEKKGVGQHAG